MKRAPMVAKMRERLKANSQVNLVDMDIPRTNGIETPKLKDIVEHEVEDKYYLKNEIVEKIVKDSEFKQSIVSFKVSKK